MTRIGGGWLPAGTILYHPGFYADNETGELKPKFLFVLATTGAGDVIWRLLTSRQRARPEQPPCYHGDSYPGFYLGLLDTSAGLGKKSWLDLRGFDDGDGMDVVKSLDAGELTIATTIHGGRLRAAQECAAAADDTTRARACHSRCAGGRARAEAGNQGPGWRALPRLPDAALCSLLSMRS
jgi:hypothetical protein